MRIKSIRLQHFRCVQDASIECDSLTALVGPNGAGKSSFLRALEIFYASRPALDDGDFYDNDTDNDIEITVTFTKLMAEAHERFGSYIQGDELSVTRVLSMRDGVKKNSLHGSRLNNPDFREVRQAASASAGNDEYRRLRSTPKYGGLPVARSYPSVLIALDQWESEHPADSVRSRDEGQFFGWSEVGKGYLGRFTRLISVPAVRDATADADEGRGSAITELMDLVVRSALARREDLQKLRDDTQARYRKIVDEAATESLRGLEGLLNSTLKTYVPDAAVQLTWMPPEQINIPQPKADLKLSEDRYAATVERTGHGLQRAFILTMLQQLAVASPAPEEEEEVREPRKSKEALTQNAATNTDGSVSPDLILSIEEPELYQHPSRQRHLADVLVRLAGGVIEGTSSGTQIIYTTHSPLFVGLDRFHQVRVFRKVNQDPNKPKLTVVRSISGDGVARELWEATDPRPASVYTWQTLEPRLISSMTPFMGEGFFADVAVLVEGEDDRAAILGCAKLMGHNLDSLGIAVIPCGGKPSLDRPLVIFRSFGIRCYVVWDGDADESKANPSDNVRLLRLLGVAGEEHPSTQSKQTFACFHDTLESSLRKEIGSALFNEILDACQVEYDIPKKEHALKNPYVYAEVIRRSEDRGANCNILRSIVTNIVERRSNKE